MKNNIVIDISPQYLAKIWALSYGPKWCQLIKLKDYLKCNILRQKRMINFIFGTHINIEVFTSWYYHLCVTRNFQSTQNKSFQYLHKSMELKLIFCLQISKNVFFKMIVSSWVCLARHAQSTQEKFTIPLKYIKENVKDEVDFWPADKRRTFLQCDTTIWGVCGQTYANYPK